jgi:hypothetical protein
VLLTVGLDLIGAARPRRRGVADTTSKHGAQLA